MKLEYKNDFQSITKFNSVDLPEFTILTGTNGSGKTHLLKAIKNGAVQIDSIDKLNDIVYFDYVEFKVNNESELNSFQLRQERQSVWEFFNTSNQPKFGILKNNLQAIKAQCFPLTNTSEKITSIAKQKNKTILSLTEEDVNEKILYDNLMRYKKELEKLFSHPELIKQQNLSSIIFISRKYDSFLDEITHDEFITLFEPIFLKENLLPIQIGKIFLEYRMKEFQETISNFQTLNENTFEIKNKIKQKCTERYGGHTPWEVVNSFLIAFNNFDYEISYPNELDLPNYSNQEGLRFTPELKDKSRNLSIPYNQLSSGEQILFSLALCLFKSKSDNMFPKVLLLDEIDATLHPTMIENLFNVIQDLFLKHGTKVILSTHSPTTVALAPKESVYLVNKESTNKITKSDKKNALSILTQGFATLEEGLQLADQLSNKEIIIITEGKNADYIKKAISFFAGDFQNKIDVLEGVESITGKDQLKLYWELFSSIPHTNKILFVWDSDAENYGKLGTKNKTYAYSFPRNITNHIVEVGIENLFDEELFEGFTVTITDDATQEKTIKFNARKHKNDFLEKIMTGNNTTFKNFKPLFDYIQTILDSEKTL